LALLQVDIPPSIGNCLLVNPVDDLGLDLGLDVLLLDPLGSDLPDPLQLVLLLAAAAADTTTARPCCIGTCTAAVIPANA
jgi:hypothetical protein